MTAASRDTLRELAADCRVRIGGDIRSAPEEGGSGVWIAPGTVLTCAHVVPSGLNSKVQIGWDGHVLTGTVSDQVPATSESGLWAYPDLAIIVVDNAPDHPCAWLSESLPGRNLIVFGHSAELHEGLQGGEREGHLGGIQAFGGGEVWQFKGNELAPGMSGGLVLDISNGAVCGIVSMAIGEDSDRGGYVVPIRSLRDLGISRHQEVFHAHDRFHRDSRSWTNLRAEIPRPYATPYPLTPSEEVELLGFLAEFSIDDADRLLALAALSSTDIRIPRPPGTLRDIVYILLDGGSPDSEVRMSILKMVHYLVGTNQKSSHQDFYDWATAFAERYRLFSRLHELRRSSATDSLEQGVVAVEIAPGLNAVDLFRLTVAVEQRRHGCWNLYQDQEPVHTLDQVKQLACDQLRSALARLDGNARVEFVVPIELFDEPFDELVPTKRYTNLGRKYCVVLRDYDRQRDPLVQHDWRRRWQQFQTPGRGVRWIDCGEDLTQVEFSAELERNPGTAVLAFTRSPASSAMVSDMMRVALDSGVPVAVWSRGTCPEHEGPAGGATCSGRRFQAAISPYLSASVIGDLPEAIRKLRNAAALREPAAEAIACRATVLLWDDPTRITDTASPVREPPYQSLEDT